MEANITYTDRPMNCCGLAAGHGFDVAINTGGKIPEMRLFRGLGGKYEQKPTGFFFNETRVATKADQVARLEYLEQRADGNGRACVLISLSEAQPEAIAAAEDAGYKRLIEFYNPNSGNQVYLYAKAEYADHAAYKAVHKDDDEDEEED